MKELIKRSYNTTLARGKIGMFSTPETLMSDFEAKTSELIFLYEKYKVIDNKGMINKFMDVAGHIFNIMIRLGIEPDREFKHHVEFIESLLNIENNERQAE